MLPLALGTQTGGSVLRPASFCGVTGYKPTFRLIPTVGMKVFSWHLDTIGLFGARVADVAYGAAAITGRDLDLADADIGPARFAVVRTARAHLADAASHAALDSAIAALAKAGADVREIALPEEIEAADAIHPVIQDYEAGTRWPTNMTTASCLRCCAGIWRRQPPSRRMLMTRRAAPPSARASASATCSPIVTPCSPSRHPARRRRVSPPRIGHVQPPVDADGHALRQRARPPRPQRPAVGVQVVAASAATAARSAAAAFLERALAAR